MDFKKWLELQEVSTSTADIAGYSFRWSPGGSGDVVRRNWPGDQSPDPFFKKKKKKDKKDEDD